jgi:hypothetical protein
MEKGHNSMGLRLRKVQGLLILCTVVLSLGWMVSVANSAVFGEAPLTSTASSSGSGPRDFYNGQIPPEPTLLAQQKPVPSKSQGQEVIVNGVRLSEDKVKTLERQYGIRILPGDYWYDKMCGAWGFRGGPSAGLILPFLDLGGPLQADASNGNTGVFINGRQLHMLDVIALQQITPVYQGRYWVDAQGNIGLEGGPALINLWLLANSRGVKKEGILSTYDKTGVAVLGY